jgi:hypothetical protein
VTSSGGLPNVIPRDIVLDFYYYQVDQGYKRLVRCEAIYDPLTRCHTITSQNAQRTEYEAMNISQCVLDVDQKVALKTYTLSINLISMDYKELLKSFSFFTDVYIIYFILTGIVSIFFSALLWVINRVLTRLRHPPPFHYFVLLYTIAQPALIGSFLGVAPIFFTSIFVDQWFKPFNK